MILGIASAVVVGLCAGGLWRKRIAEGREEEKYLSFVESLPNRHCEYLKQMQEEVRQASEPPNGDRYRVARDAGGIWRVQHWTVKFGGVPPMFESKGWAWAWGLYADLNTIAFDGRDEAQVWLQRFLTEDAEPVVVAKVLQ